MNICICVCVLYVCVSGGGACLCVGANTPVYVCGGQKLTLDLVSQASSSLFIEIESLSLIGLRFTYEASLAGSVSQRSTFPVLGLQVGITTPCFFI